jgi:hypothetical protein
VQKLAEVRKTLKDQQFSQHIDTGLTYLAQSQLNLATQSLSQAKQLYPSRPEVTLLTNKIKTANQQAGLQNALKQVKQFTDNDQWQHVAGHIATLPDAFKNHPQLQRNAKLAQQVLRINKKMAVYLKRPERLSDNHIREQAQDVVNQSEPLIAHSAQLNQKREALQRTIDTLSTKVSVTLHSDGKTDIVVIGQGRIGKTTGRKVELLPGQYVFEGSCAGYRSTRVKLNVQPKQVNSQITVVCHERI